jgi:arylsulfatase A-like enzyme
VPLIVRPAGGQSPAVHNRPASIGDIPATLLALAGCEIPAYMDAIPLPELGIPTQERPILFGFLASGCMAFDGEWKLVKYASGDVLLFNLKEDPQEQENCAGEEECQSIYLRLDAALSAEMLRSINDAHSDKVVAHISLYDNEEFGQAGWERTYPEVYR